MLRSKAIRGLRRRGVCSEDGGWRKLQRRMGAGARKDEQARSGLQIFASTSVRIRSENDEIGVPGLNLLLNVVHLSGSSLTPSSARSP